MSLLCQQSLVRNMCFNTVGCIWCCIFHYLLVLFKLFKSIPFEMTNNSYGTCTHRDALNGINVLTAFLLLLDFQFCSCDFRKMCNVSKIRVCFPIPVRILMLTMHLWNCLSWLMPVKLPVQEESLVWLNYMYTVMDHFTVDSILINSWKKTNFILLLFCRCHSLPAILQTG